MLRRIRFAAEYLALAVYSTCARLLPRRWALAMGRQVGNLGWALGLRRRVVLENLARVFPTLSEQDRRELAADSCRNFGRVATEFARFPGSDRDRVDEIVTVEGVEALRAAAAEGPGALVVTGHLGSWALYVAALSSQGLPTALLVGRHSNPMVNRFIHGLPGDAIKLIGKGTFSPRGVMRCLDEGRVVLIVADQHSRVGVDADFLGHAGKTLSLPGAILQRRPRPLFLLEGVHVGGGHHRVELTRLELPSCGGEDSLLAVAELCNRAIGEAVLRHPEQYFWHHRRWKPELEDDGEVGGA